jgi:hypothetical protein
MLTHSPRAFPWETSLPWTPVRVRNSIALSPEDAALARGSGCVKGAGASASRGVGTSATARSRNASGRSAAGRRCGGRPNIARLGPSGESDPPSSRTSRLLLSIVPQERTECIDRFHRLDLAPCFDGWIVAPVFVRPRPLSFTNAPWKQIYEYDINYNICKILNSILFIRLYNI